MYGKFGYFAIWLPTVGLKLGDIGVIKGGLKIWGHEVTKSNEFVRMTTLEKKGIDFEIRSDNTPGNFEYSSAKNTTFKVEGSAPLKGWTLAKADAGAVIEFGDEAGVVFKANNVLNPSIEDKTALGEEILKRYDKREWNEDWVIITELCQVNSATIIISSGGGGKIELKANGQINAGNINIADVNANFQTVYSKNIHTRIIAEEGLTPLFKVQGIKYKGIIIGKPTFEAISKLGLSSRTREMPKKVERVKVPIFENIDFIREEDSQ
jgi:hypothetical protein